MEDASPLFCTDVALVTMYINYISRLLPQWKRKDSQDAYKAVRCAKRWAWGAGVGSGGGGAGAPRPHGCK